MFTPNSVLLSRTNTAASITDTTSTAVTASTATTSAAAVDTFGITAFTMYSV